MVMIALFFIDTVALFLCSCISFMTVGNFQTVYLFGFSELFDLLC